MNYLKKKLNFFDLLVLRFENEIKMHETPVVGSTTVSRWFIKIILTFNEHSVIVGIVFSFT